MRVLAIIAAIVLTSCTMSTVAPLPYDEKNGIDNDGIRQTVIDHQPEAQQCLKLAIQDNPAVEGKVIMLWEINKEGLVTESHVKENKTGSTALGNCLQEASKKWVFPKLTKSDTVTVIYPLGFSRKIN